MESYLRALLRDTYCGYLDQDLRRVADDLIVEAASRSTSARPTSASRNRSPVELPELDEELEREYQTAEIKVDEPASECETAEISLDEHWAPPDPSRSSQRPTTESPRPSTGAPTTTPAPGRHRSNRPVASSVHGMAEAEGYVYDQAFSKERERLAGMEALWDPGTVRALEAVGVAEGWRCLEVGAGAGSVAQWLADRVGEGGKVIATDLNTKYAEPVAAREPGGSRARHHLR